MNVLHSTTLQDEKRTDKDLATQWNSTHWKDVMANVNRMQTRIAKAVVWKESFPIAARLPGCEMLEPYDAKVSSTVLRRGGRGDSSPLFGVSTEMKALIDRAGYVARANDHMFRRKVGAAVVAARRAGAIHAFDTLNHFFLISQMIVPGSSYWNIGFGLAPGDVKSDKEGLDTMKTLGTNMAWLMNRL